MAAMSRCQSNIEMPDNEEQSVVKVVNKIHVNCWTHKKIPSSLHETTETTFTYFQNFQKNSQTQNSSNARDLMLLGNGSKINQNKTSQNVL